MCILRIHSVSKRGQASLNCEHLQVWNVIKAVRRRGGMEAAMGLC